MKLFASLVLGAYLLSGPAALADVYKTVTLKVTSAPELRSYGDLVQLGFNVEQGEDHFFLSCSVLPTVEASGAQYMFQGSYGQSVRLEGSHLIRENGEFLIGIKREEDYQDCIAYLHEVASALNHGGTRVLLIGNDDTSVTIDVK